MERRFSWCTVVALLVLLFVTTEGLRGHNTQIDAHKTHDASNRGALRFSPKLGEETTTVSTSLPSRAKSIGDRTSQSRRSSSPQRNTESTTLRSFSDSRVKAEANTRSSRLTRTTDRSGVSSVTETAHNSRRKSPRRQVEETNVEAAVSRRNDRRYLPENNERRKARNNDQDVALEAPKESTGRKSNRRDAKQESTEKLNNKGPSVFAATTEYSRSRTGRKIHTTYTSKELKNQVPSSRRFQSRQSEAETTTVKSGRLEGRSRSSTERSIDKNGGGNTSKSNVKEDNSTSRRRQDVLSESESVRVDVPFPDGITNNPVSSVLPSTVVTESSNVASPRKSSRVISRRSDTKESSRSAARDVSKSRGRSSDGEASGSAARSNSRRGFSKFSDFATIETTEQSVGTRRNTGSRDRARNSEGKARSSASESRARPRGRNAESGSKDAAAGSLGLDARRKSSGDRSSDRKATNVEARSKSIENRVQDQDSRGRSRNRARIEAITPSIPDTTTTSAPETTVSNDASATTTEAEVMITTIKPVTSTTASTRTTTRTSSTTSTTEASARSRTRGRGNSPGRKAPKEDFFNHGLGFRGRKIPSEVPSTGGESRRSKSSKNESQPRGNPGWTLRRRPGYSNKPETTTKTVLPSTKDQTNEILPPNEQLTSTEVITTIESSTSTVRRGFKKQQTTEDVTLNGTTMKSIRRGNKTFEKTGTGVGKSAVETLESDNYPPEFKARLSQLKNASSKLSPPKTTPRPTTEEQLENEFGRRLRGSSNLLKTDDLEAAASGNVFPMDLTLITNPITSINGTEMRYVKKSSAALFAERSRMKLELARKLVKPGLNIEDNDLEATTASSFGKSNPTETPAVDESKKVIKITKITKVTEAVDPGRGSRENSQGEKPGKDSKLSRSRKGLDDQSKSTTRGSALKKGRIISERMVTSISVEELIKDSIETTKPYESTTVSVTVPAEEGAATTIDTTRVRLPNSRVGKKPKEDTSSSNKSLKSPSSHGRLIEKTNPSTTIKPKKPYPYASRNSKINDDSTTLPSVTTIKPKKTYSFLRGYKNSDERRKSKTSEDQGTTKKPALTSGASKARFQPRYNKRPQKKNLENEVDYQTTVTSTTSIATSRYSRKKSEVVVQSDKPLIATTERTGTQIKRKEFRPRTATYRRHSEVPTTLIESSTKLDGVGVAITPRSPRYHATVKFTTPTPRSVPQEPLVSLKIANESVQQTTGITGSSNGDSGNTNIFNPTRSLFLNGNTTLLEQLRSTVAPLLSSLGNRTPVFSGSYTNVNNANSPPRITPSGSPPRFSARYKGAELFVRKPAIYQATVPSITSSSTTPFTPVESSGSPPSIDVSNPGESKFLTYYHALESANIRNEQGNSSSRQEQTGRVAQVDSNAPVPNGISSSSNNDTISPTVATASPQTPDTTVNTTQGSTLSLRLSEDAENSTPAVTTEAPGLENPSSTEQPSTSVESISTSEQVSTSTESISTTQQVSTSPETISTTQQVSTSPEPISTTQQVSTSTEPISTTQQVSTSTEPIATTQQVSTSPEPISTTQQVSTSPEPISTTQQVSTDTESIATTEQVSTSTETISMNQQISGSTELASTTEQASTSADITSTTEQVSTTTVSVSTSREVETTTAPNEALTTNAPSAINTEASNNESENLSSTLGSNDVDTFDTSSTTPAQNLGTSTLPETTATVSMTTTTLPMVDSSENPETNTIDYSEATSTQTRGRLIDDPTTEAVANNLIDAETTAIPDTTTFRNRLIDFAQDILSRLQAAITTTTVPSLDVITTIAPSTEMSNVIEDSTRNTTMETLAQLRDIETTSSSTSNPVETTTVQTVQTELRETTTLPSSTMDLSSLRTGEETTTQNAVGSITTSISTTDQPNTLIPTTETNTQDDVESITVTTQTVTNIDSTTVSDDLALQSLSNVETTSESPMVSNNTDGNFENSTDLPVDMGTTVQSVTTSRYTTSTSDTLLTELMSIAKTLLMEKINESEDVLPTQSISDDTFPLGTTPTDFNNSTEVGNLVNPEVDRSTLSNDAVGTTQIPESSSPLDVTTEIVESTTANVGSSTEDLESVTSSVDPTQNEIESDDLILTTESNSTPQPDLVDNEVEFVQTTQTTARMLGSTFENLESTPLPVTENESRMNDTNTTPLNTSIGPDETTQSQTTQSTETTDASITNFELTTNTYDLFSSNLIVTTETQTPSENINQPENEPTEQSIVLTTTTIPTPESVTQLNGTSQSLNVTMVTPVLDSILSRVNPLASTQSGSTESNINDMILTTTDSVGNVTNDVDVTANPTTESVIDVVSNLSTTEVGSNESIEITTPAMITTTLIDNSMDVTEATTNEPSLTTSTELATDRVTNVPITTEPTNTFGETTTTNNPQTTPNLENETPTIIARFQDAMSTTAQGTAGSRISQTTEINIPMITESSTMPSSNESSTPPLSSSSLIGSTTSSSAETTIATTMTETATSTSTERLPDERTSQTTTELSRGDVITVTPISETTVPTTSTTININENLVSTEVTSDVPGTTTVSPQTATVANQSTMTPPTTTTTATTMMASTSEASTASPTSTTSRTTLSTSTRPSIIPITQTTPYVGRFGASRLTPAPRFSPSSSTRAPLRDYLIYGIYPNKTIVRKRPEDNLIDARNVDSPYVIFGIFPDGRLVRKFPNGTIIPDPPTNPVEVVFSLSTTTTTNRPPPRLYYNQANQGTYNQYQAPAYYNNRRPIAELMRNVQSPGTVDLGLTGNAIVGSNGGGPDFTGPLGTPGSVATTTKMSDVLVNTRMGTTPNAMSAIASLLTPIASTGRPPTESQGGRIVEDREREEATRTKEAGGQRSSVYIGQDKFVNYWTDGAPSTNPRVVNVRINSVATAANEGSSSSASVPSFENLLSNQPSGRVTAPPGFPWRDPLDQIFGITTPSSIITASVASNTLDDSVEVNVPINAQPINPFVEVFTPVSSTIGNAQAATITATPSTTAATSTTTMPTTTTTTTTTTAAPTTTTTTAAPTTTTTTPAPTTTTTTTMAPTTTTTTMAPTTTTTTMAPTTTTPMPVTIAPAVNRIASQTTMTAATTEKARTLGPVTTPFGAPNNLLTNMPSQNAFGTTFDDLAFLNSLLQVPQSQPTTPKTLTEVEQLLANKILSLALSKPGPIRAAKAVDAVNASPNQLVEPPVKSSEPIVIDLFPSSTAASPTWIPPVTQEPTTQKPKESSSTTAQPIQKPAPTSNIDNVAVPSASTSATVKTTLISTTKGPLVIAAKTATTVRPRTTTQAPVGFGASLWQALFGGNNLFGPSTTQRPVKPITKQVKTPPKSVSITPKSVQITQRPVEVTQKPIQSTQKPAEATSRVSVISKIPSTSAPPIVNISKIQVVTPNSIGENEKSVTTQRSVSTTKQPLLNNPNPRLPNVVTSTYSPEEDAKFLANLLRALQTDGKKASPKQSSGLTQDDELFLRAILSGQGLASTTSAPSTEISNAALLAAILKAQGIEPSTPPNNIREQLQLASLGQSVTSAPSPSTTTGSTTITTRPPSTTRPTVTTKKTVTPRPTSRPRLRTTTWSPSSTYPPPLFSSFANYGTPVQSPAGDNSGNGGLFGATRAFGQFLGAAITGAAQQLQSIVRNGTRIVSGVVG